MLSFFIVVVVVLVDVVDVVVVEHIQQQVTYLTSLSTHPSLTAYAIYIPAVI